MPIECPFEEHTISAHAVHLVKFDTCRGERAQLAETCHSPAAESAIRFGKRHSLETTH